VRVVFVTRPAPRLSNGVTTVNSTPTQAPRPAAANLESTEPIDWLESVRRYYAGELTTGTIIRHFASSSGRCRVSAIVENDGRRDVLLEPVDGRWADEQFAAFNATAGWRHLEPDASFDEFLEDTRDGRGLFGIRSLDDRRNFEEFRRKARRHAAGEMTTIRRGASRNYTTKTRRRSLRLDDKTHVAASIDTASTAVEDYVAALAARLELSSVETAALRWLVVRTARTRAGKLRPTYSPSAADIAAQEHCSAGAITKAAKRLGPRLASVLNRKSCEFSESSIHHGGSRRP
jgi:hypothetical protein